MNALVRWWVIFWAIVVGTLFLSMTGLIGFAWDADHSKLGFVALAVFAILTPFVGYLTYSINYKGLTDQKRYLQACWFGADTLMGIGMSGTLVGIMMMFSEAMGKLDVANKELVQAIIVHLSHGFTTAVITTLIGVVASMLLKLQLVNLEVALDSEDEEA